MNQRLYGPNLEANMSGSMKSNLQELFQSGEWLGDYGINSWAFEKQRALSVLETLLAWNIPVLGGDVFHENNGKLDICVDNWYCNPAPDENLSEYVRRSVGKARNFISGYKNRSGRVIFVLVADADVRSVS